MSNYHHYKQSKLRSGLVPRSAAEAARLPEQVCDYIKLADTRFDEVARLYLEGLTISDLQFMQPEDLICVVPPPQYNHKLLMSILVRRYLFRDDDDDGVLDVTQGPRDDVSFDDRSTDRRRDRHHRNKKHDSSSDFCGCSECESVDSRR